MNAEDITLTATTSPAPEVLTPDKLLVLRRLSGYSLEDLGKALLVTHVTCQRRETGKLPLSPDLSKQLSFLIPICDAALGVYLEARRIILNAAGSTECLCDSGEIEPSPAVEPEPGEPEIGESESLEVGKT